MKENRCHRPAMRWIAVLLLMLLAVCGSSKEAEFSGVVPLPGGGTLELVKIRAGTFIMGSPQKEVGTWGKSWGEQQRKVTLTRDYWIAKFETTQDQYQAVMHKNPSKFIGGQRPVENISWPEAMAFCEKLNLLTTGQRPKGYVFSLPTEAQWEYACRAGTTSALNNGKNLQKPDVCSNLDQVGWYLANSEGKTHAVGQKKPNRWGLYDMHGNAWEWCSDWYGINNTETIDPCGPKSGKGRVKKGGGFYLDAKRSRSGARSFNLPDEHKWYLTIRVALVPEAKGNYEKDSPPKPTSHSKNSSKGDSKKTRSKSNSSHSSSSSGSSGPARL